MATDQSAWTAPPPVAPVDPGRLPGALHGSLLYEQPRHAEVRARIEGFCAGDGPLVVEVGFDHGMRILDHARRWTDVRWLGIEIRKRRVEAAAPHAPANALLVHGDARTVLAALVPDGRVAQVDVLFPTPAADPRHLLLTPAMVDTLRRVLAPDGVVQVATDVRGMADWAATLFEGWPALDGPYWSGPVLSRRERVCRRDGKAVWRLVRRRP